MTAKYQPFEWWLYGLNAATPAEAANAVYSGSPAQAGGETGGINWIALHNEYGSTFDGTGIKIGDMDTGVDLNNVDLAGHFDLTLSEDPRDAPGSVNIQTDVDPTTGLPYNAHGTYTAGVIGAGGTYLQGVASGATMVDFYVRFGLGGSSLGELIGLMSDAATKVDVLNNSWGFSIQFSDNFLKPAWYDMRDAIVDAATNGRGGLGTNIIFAGGNDRQYAPNTTLDGDNTNYHSMSNDRHIITVAATAIVNDAATSYADVDGLAPFSTPGASILVAAPGDNILTTSYVDDADLTNDVVKVSGTSLSAPATSGVVGLMLQANPLLGYRDVQDILVITSHKVDMMGITMATYDINGDTHWNGGGNLVNHDVGFGEIDALAAVHLAQTWKLQSTETNESVITTTTSGGSTAASTQSFTFNVSGYTHFSESWITLDIDLTQDKMGDLNIHLISPDGTDSVLMDYPAAGTNGYGSEHLLLSTVHNWGENPNGVWTVVVNNAQTVTTGTDSVATMTLNIYGDNYGTNDTYFYTDDLSNLTGRGTLADTNGGVDTVNLSALSSAVTFDMVATHTSTIDGQSVTIASGTQIENVIGTAYADTIYGNSANNNIDGFQGADTMVGGTGDDIYHVDNAGDIVTENSSEGQDSVYSTLSTYTLTSNVEDGYVDHAAGSTIYGNSLNNHLYGNVGSDTLIGGAGDDTLDGGVGAADNLVGGTGNDTYNVHQSGDAITENSGEGYDTVQSYVSTYTMGANLERGLIMSTSGTWSLTGNSGNNDLGSGGGSSNNTLVGGGGNDTFSENSSGTNADYGGTGNDVFYFNGTGTDYQYGNGGNDYFYNNSSGTAIQVASGSGVNVEVGSATGYTWQYAGSGGDYLVGGNGGNNQNGGSGTDHEYSGSGNDVMTGGAGNDVFVFGASTQGHDVITDFVTGHDIGVFDHTNFATTASVLASMTADTGGVYVNRGSDWVYFQGHTLTDFHTSDFLIV